MVNARSVARIHWIAIFLLAIAFTPVHSTPSLAQTATVGPSTGLPLPRFASVRNAGTNVRVGPGTRYNVAWIFRVPNVPVEIVQEFDVWRKIRDSEGAEGWLHQSLVSGTRTGIVTPWDQTGQVPLRASADPQSGVRAWLTPNLIVTLRRCTGSVCEARLSHADENGRTREYAGYVEQTSLWGVYPDEEF